MKMKSQIKLVGAVFIAGVVLTGCGNSPTHSKKQVLNWETPASLSTMDPAQSTDLYADQMMLASGEGLLRMQANNKVVPGVAKTYSVSKSGKTWTFDLRHSKWSDGSQLTAKDFVNSWRRTVNPSTKSQYAYMFSDIKNAAKITAGRLAPSQLGVKANNNYQLTVHLNKAQPAFKYLVSASCYLPENQAALKKYGHRFGTNSTTNTYNGPFLLKGWNGTNDTWHLVKNPKYWNAKNIQLHRINVQAVKNPSTALNSYESGKLDFTYLSGTQVKQYEHNRNYHLFKDTGMFYIEMNERKDRLLKNRLIRRALSLTINRQQYANKVLSDGSAPAKGLVADNMAKRNGRDFADQAYVKGAVAYNLAQAKKDWQRGLKQVNKKSATLTLVSDDKDTSKQGAEFIQSSLEKLPGLKVTIQSVPLNNRVSRAANGQFDLILSGTINDYPDPDDSISSMTTNNVANNGKWHNSAFDRLINRAENTDANHESARWNDLVQAEKILMTDQGVIPLYQQSLATLIRPSVKGLQFMPTAPEWDWTKTHMN